MKILSTMPLYPTKFLTLNETTYEDRQRKLRKWVWAERPNQTSAVIIAATYRPLVTDPEQLVVIKEFRVPLGDYAWGLPAGLIDPGESIEETAIREMKEETGLDVVSFFKPPSPGIYSSAGITDEKVFIAYARAEGDFRNSSPDDSEDIEVHLMTPIQVTRLLESRERICAKAYFVFDRFATYGEI